MARPGGGPAHLRRGAALGRSRLAALALLAACTTTRTAAPLPPAAPEPARVELPAETVEARRADLDLVGRNDQELFALAQAAFQSGDHPRAASAFERIADLFPASPRHAAALYDAGLARLRLEDWPAARRHFARFRQEYTGPDADDAAFKLAECHWRLHELEPARALLDELAARSDLPPVERIRAFTQRGVVELEAGEVDGAERSLQVALSLWSQAQEEERIDDEAPAKAQYWLGEVWRARFEVLRVDPAAPEAQLAAAMERKSQALVSARGHYERAIRARSPSFGAAALGRIGEMYDAFVTELLEAPVPPELDDEQARAYRAELWREVRPAVGKAVEAYEATLGVARGRGVEGPFVQRTEGALERLKMLVVAADAAGAPGGR